MTDKQKWKEFDEAIAWLKSCIEEPDADGYEEYPASHAAIVQAHRVLDLLTEMGQGKVFGLEIYTRHIKNKIEIAVFFEGWTTDIEDGFAGADVWIFDCKTFPEAVFAAVTSDKFKTWQKALLKGDGRE